MRDEDIEAANRADGRTAAERIYKDIKNDVIRAYYATDEFLVERGIAGKYGVSKTPVREALRRLCQEGYLVSYPRKGYLVNSARAGDHIELQQARFLIEAGCLRLIVRSASDDDIESLRRIPTDDQADVSAGTANSAFHLALVQLVRNPYLIDTEERLLGLLQGMLHQITFLSRNIDVMKYHAAIIDALARRDILAAEEALRRDLTLGENDI